MSYAKNGDDVQNNHLINMQIYEINGMKSSGSNITAFQTPSVKEVYIFEVPSSWWYCKSHLTLFLAAKLAEILLKH